jgi:hypothetical protein
MRSTARFFNIPEKFLTPEIAIAEIQKAVKGTKTAFIFRAKQEDRAIGFHHQGGEPFTRFCRYSYPRETSFSTAFKCQESPNPLKAHLIGEVDVYPEGIIAVRNFSGVEKIFVAEDLPDNGIKITREEFENTHFVLKKMAI